MIKNKKLLTGLVIFASVAVFGAYNLMAAGNADPGSNDDPLITLSYLNQQTEKIKSELSQKITTLEAELSSIKKDLGDAKAQIASLKGGSGQNNPGSGSTTQPQTPTPTPTPTPPANGGQSSNLGVGYVTASSLNVRSGAGTNFSIVGSLINNTKVTLVSQSGDWYKIQYGNLSGWVLGTYIKKT